VTDASVTRALSAGVQQAFLPKFENEGQDEAIADQVGASAQQGCKVSQIVVLRHTHTHTHTHVHTPVHTHTLLTTQASGSYLPSHAVV
jgi:hypothetical protein